MVLGLGAFVMVVLLLVAVSLTAFGFAIYSLVEAARAPEAAYGPPWDNSKNAWILGLALAFVLPAGVIVGPILWWISGHAALRRGEQVPRPFWAPRPSYPPPYYPPQQPPPGPPQP